MLALAAARLGFDTLVLTPESDSPAGRVAANTVVADYEDEDALAKLARDTDVVTFEFENVPAAAVARLQALQARVAPGPPALAVAQDRVQEKRFFHAHGMATAGFCPVDGVEDIRAGLERLGRPALLKTRREGYDGKGQTWVQDERDAEAAFARIGRRPAILEAGVTFRRELSVIAARSWSGDFVAYPLTENRHQDGVLRHSLAPADADAPMCEAALHIARTTLDRLDYVGVAGIELFDTAEGLKVNEIAPRVHNSGHWTLDACEVDQFEQHVRAIAGWPLGPTEPFAAAEMTNLLGEAAEDWSALSADRSARVWLYGKRDTAPGRKMGHVTRLSPRRSLKMPGV